MKKGRRDFIKKSSVMMASGIAAPGLWLREARAEAASTDSATDKAMRLVVTLYELPNFQGQSRTIVEDTQDLGEQDFNDKAQSIKISIGPEHPSLLCGNLTNAEVEEPTVSFFENPRCQGDVLTLKKGCYPNIGRSFNFGGIITSVAFDIPACVFDVIDFIPLIVELFEDPNFGGSKVVMVKESLDLGAEFGPRFNRVSSIRIRPGPTIDETTQPGIQLFSAPNHGGPVPSDLLGVGDHRSLDVFDDRVRSIKFPPHDIVPSNCRQRVGHPPIPVAQP